MGRRASFLSDLRQAKMNAMAKTIVTKEQFENPCAGCGAHEGTGPLCCQGFVIETPVRDGQVNLDVLHWYLVRGQHLGFRVQATFTLDGPTRDPDAWVIFVPERCSHLQADGRCGIYDTRPVVCREYPPFPSKRADDAEYLVTGCERYDPEPAPTFVFTDPDVLAQRLKTWFDYDPPRDAVRYVPDRKRLRIKHPQK